MAIKIFLRKRKVRTIRLSAHDAIEEGDTDTLREDIIESFSDDDTEEIERRIDGGDFYEFLSDVLEEWGGDDVVELFELLGQMLSDCGIDLSLGHPEDEFEDDEEDEEDEKNDADEDDAEG